MLKKFVSWIRTNEIRIIEKGERILSEALWGQWTYKVPEDKEQEMYDFYTLEYLLSEFDRGAINNMLLDPKGRNMWRPPVRQPQTGKDYADIPEEAPMTSQMKYNHALVEAANKLLPHLRDELLQVVFFSIAAEMRHLTDANDAKSVIQMTKYGPGNLGGEDAQLLKNYLMQMDYAKQTEHKPDSYSNYEAMPLSPLLDSSNSSYKKSYEIMNSIGTKEQWARVASHLFHSAKWAHMFGGHTWGLIADGWLRLNKAHTPNEMILAIDHIYDLEHNTGSVFTKVKSYSKHGYKWVKKGLDHKKYVLSPHEFIEHVSPSMKELALIGIKIKTGKTWEDFINDWPEILKSKTKIYNDSRKSDWEKVEKEKSKGAVAYNKAKDEYYKKWSEYGPPQNVNSQTYATKHFEPSDNPWSVYNVNKATNKQEAKVSFDDIEKGDQVAISPWNKWYWVLSKNAAGNELGHDALTVSDDPESKTGFVINLNKVYAHRSKEDALKSPEVLPKPTPQSAPASHAGHTDSTGKSISVGDTVKKVVSSTGKIGTVTDLLSSNMVYVKWNGPHPANTYASNQLQILSKAGEAVPTTAPTPTAPTPTPMTPINPVQHIPSPAPASVVHGGVVHGENPEVGDSVKIFDKWYTTLTAVYNGYITAKDDKGDQYAFSVANIQQVKKNTLAEPAPKTEPIPIPKPEPGAMTPEEEKNIFATRAKNIANSLPKLPKSYKFARIIMGLNSISPINKVLDNLEEAFGVKFTTSELSEIKDAYTEEYDSDNYYAARSHLKFPKNLNSNQAFNQLKQKFPYAPHVPMDDDAENAIKTLLKGHLDAQAVQKTKIATQFNFSGALGYTVYTKLSLYALGEMTD